MARCEALTGPLPALGSGPFIFGYVQLLTSKGGVWTSAFASASNSPALMCDHLDLNPAQGTQPNSSMVHILVPSQRTQDRSRVSPGLPDDRPKSHAEACSLGDRLKRGHVSPILI
jgi:hypothetical protein